MAKGYEQIYKEEFWEEYRKLRRLASFGVGTIRTHGGQVFTKKELQERIEEIERLFPNFAGRYEVKQFVRQS